MEILAEFPVIFGIVDYIPCDSADFISEGTQPQVCTPGVAVAPNLSPGSYVAFVAPLYFGSVPDPKHYRTTIIVEPTPPETCLVSAWEAEYRLGSVFVGQSSVSEVPVVNASQRVIEVTASVDAPFLHVLQPGPFTVQPQETLWIPVQFTAPVAGYVDCGISFTGNGCLPLVGELTVEGEIPPLVPGPPVLQPGRTCGSVALQINLGGNSADVNYVIAASVDHWVTTLYVQTDGSLGVVPIAEAASTWNNILAEDIAGFVPGQMLRTRSLATLGGHTTPFGAESSLEIPACPQLTAPQELTIQRIEEDLLLRWQPVLYDASGHFPVMDAKYIVRARDSFQAPATIIDTVQSDSIVLYGETAARGRRFYEIIVLSEQGPLLPSLMLTAPDPGEVLTGPFIMAAIDKGAGRVSENVCAVFQAKVNGTWINISERRMPQWMAGTAVWSAMVDVSAIPSGPCSLAVVETGPFGITRQAHEVVINLPPVPSIITTINGGIVTFDGSGSSDAEGPITMYCWTMPNGTHQYGPVVSIPTAPGDTSHVTLEVTDNAGETRASSSGVVCNAAGDCGDIGLQCGCKKMEINDSGKVKGKKKKFTNGLSLNDNNPGTTDDNQLLGPRAEGSNSQPPKDPLAAFNFEVRAELIYKDADPPGPCIHYQQVQLSEQCNGTQINTGDWYGKPDWDDAPVGGSNWLDDNYDDEMTDNNLVHHEYGDNPEVDWLDAPTRAPDPKKLQQCAPGGLTYEGLFCAVVDGPLGCCRCKFKVKWTIGANGQVTTQPSLDKTDDPNDPNDDGLGCTNGAEGSCGC
jgi:hypothetical protein